MHPATRTWLSRHAAWLTWEHQRRNSGIAEALGVRLFEFGVPGPRWRRYLIALGQTLRVLVTKRPKLLFVQNPSVVLAATACLYGWMLRARVVVDAHNGALEPLAGGRGLSGFVARLVARRAHLTIVSNPGLVPLVTAHGGRAFTLPDRLPTLPDVPSRTLAGRRHVMFICTFAADEPYLEVIEAARRLDQDTFVYITGNPRHRRDDLLRQAPPNVVFTGFLPEADYVALLRSVDAVIDLTTRDDCLVCGAYEGVAAGQPLILSDTAATRAYFSRGVRYTDNSSADIAMAVRETLIAGDTMRRAVRELRAQMTPAWEERLVDLARTVTGATAPPGRDVAPLPS